MLAALSLLVAVTAALSVRDGAPLVAGEAFLLGYVTALLSTEAATVVVTSVYALLLAAAVVAIATVKPWRGLATASAFATYAVVSLWVVVVDPARRASPPSRPPPSRRTSAAVTPSTPPASTTDGAACSCRR